MVIDLEEINSFRLSIELQNLIDTTIKNYKGIYPNRSVFIRAAIFKLVQEINQKNER